MATSTRIKPSANGHCERKGRVPRRPPSQPFGDGAALVARALGSATPDPAPTPPPPPAPTAEGRDAAGRFVKGNAGGPGNPFGRRVAELRAAFLRAATPERMQQLAEALFQRAAGGDLDALRLFLVYTIGKPAPVVNPDLMSREEWQLVQEWPHMADAFTAAGAVAFETALRALRNIQALEKPGPVHMLGQEEANPGAGIPEKT